MTPSGRRPRLSMPGRAAKAPSEPAVRGGPTPPAEVGTVQADSRRHAERLGQTTMLASGARDGSVKLEVLTVEYMMRLPITTVIVAIPRPGMMVPTLCPYNATLGKGGAARSEGRMERTERRGGELACAPSIRVAVAEPAQPAAPLRRRTAMGTTHAADAELVALRRRRASGATPCTCGQAMLRRYALSSWTTC